MTRVIEAELIRHLKRDARISISELSALLGVSRATIKTKMKALEAKGVIRQYTILTNEQSVGHSGEDKVFFLIKFSTGGDIAQLKSFCQTQKSIRGVWGVTGGWDCFILAAAPSLVALTELRQRLRQQAPIERIETAAVLDNLLA